MEISAKELEQLEHRVQASLAARDVSDLNVIGMGESSLALAWPDDTPTLVAKRLYSSADPADADYQFERIQRYITRLADFINVVPTEPRTVRVDGRTVPYLIQPFYCRDQLVENAIAADSPSVDHPIIVAITAAILATSQDGRVALDGQVSNFAWVDEELQYFDVGTPFMFDETGRSEYLGDAVVSTMPGVLRPLLSRQAQKMVDGFGGKRQVFRQAAISFPRLGLDGWLEPALVAFNRHIDEPITVDEIEARVARMHTELKVMKGMMRVQRAWVTRVRRGHFDHFITDSFSGDVH